MPEWLEQYRQERHDQEMLDLQRRQTEAAERQARGHGDIVGLLLIGLLVVGIVWGILWLLSVLVRVLGRRKNSQPLKMTEQERALLEICRANNVPVANVTEGVRQTVERLSR
jgi:hypothetical protein